MFDTTNIIIEDISINVFIYKEKESVINNEPPKLIPFGTLPENIKNKTANRLRIAKLEIVV